VTLRPILGAIGVLLLCACADQVKTADTPPHTAVSYRASVAPGAPRYAELENETSNTPTPIDNPAPRYPDSAIALHLPVVEVSAKVIVDADGKVSEVRIAPPIEAAGRPPEFDVAVRDAVLQWRFNPLRFTRWEEVKDEQGDVVDSHAVSAVARPFSLDYEFRFELRNGRPVVNGMPGGSR
jgi:hypothetical protein